MPDWYQWQDEYLYLNIHVQPRAKTNDIVGLHGDALKIRITAPPVDGKANTFLRKYLAKAMGVSPSSIELVTGIASRTKQIRILCKNKEFPAALVKFC